MRLKSNQMPKKAKKAQMFYTSALQSVKEPLFSSDENRVLVYLGIKISNITLR